MAFHLKKLWFLPPKDALWQVRLKLMLTERSVTNAWNPDFSEHSVSIQWTLRNVSVDRKEDFHPVNFYMVTSQRPSSLFARKGNSGELIYSISCGKTGYETNRKTNWIIKHNTVEPLITFLCSHCLLNLDKHVRQW